MISRYCKEKKKEEKEGEKKEKTKTKQEVNVIFFSLKTKNGYQSLYYFLLDKKLNLCLNICVQRLLFE